MLQTSSVLCSCSADPLPSSPFPLPLLRRFAPHFQNRHAHLSSASSHSCLPVPRLRNRGIAFSLPQTTQEIIETSATEAEYVEVGYISRVHGLQGEICLKPTTDFPELRFSQPGRRWLKQRVSGREKIQEIELVDGRGHPGQKSWILKFQGIDTVDQAEQLIGSTLLVKERDRPELDTGEFYSRDLVGMRVILKETTEVIGTVVSVYNSGANDLLHVQLDSSTRTLGDNGISKEEEIGASDRLIWVPFVEAIVPDVDINRREMFIMPPKGLLELNLRSNTKSKKERRQLEWKERKKFQKRVIAAKKKLVELEQQHVFHGFRYGEKSQGRLLAEQIVSVNSKLLQKALQNIQISSEEFDVAKFLGSTRSRIPSSVVEKKLSSEEKGKHLIAEGKVALLLVLNDSDRLDISNSDLGLENLEQILHCDEQKLAKVEDRGSVPLILISPSHQITQLERLFFENDYFSFDPKKVWFLEEEMLPVVSSSIEEGKRHKILMESPWEMLQSPVGSGGIITCFSSQRMTDILTELGVEFIRVCSTDRILQGRPELLLGFVKSNEAEIGIQISEETKYSDESFDMTFSLGFLNKLVKQIDKLQFFAIPKANSHVELVEKEWVDVTPTSPNSYEIRSSIYSCLNFCSSDKVCLLELTD